MRRPGSRYEESPRFERGPSPRLLRPRSIRPATGVLEHTVQVGERLDQLARRYYNDDRLWWRILDANPGILCGSDFSISASVGQVLRIPREKE